MKKDVHKRKQTYLNWKERVQREGIRELTEANSSIIIEYVLDMELGQNVSGSVKGGRSYTRLCTIYQRMTWIAKMLEKRDVSDLRKCKAKVVSKLFTEMDRGIILRENGEQYKGCIDYIKIFKAFWHWWMRQSWEKNEKDIADITKYLDAERRDPIFVWIPKERLDKILPYFTVDEQVILIYVFDSLIRAPTELSSVRVHHIEDQDKEVWLNIPKSISKSIGRSMNLLYSGQAVLDYIKRHDLSPEDYLFSYNHKELNEKLQTVTVQLFGNVRSHPEGEFYSKITLYDLRHSGAIHFRILAKENPDIISIDAVRQRGGWTDFKMLNYYTRLLGLDGKVERQGMLLRQSKHKLEEEVDALKQELAALKEMNAKVLQMASAGIPKDVKICPQSIPIATDTGITITLSQTSDPVIEIGNSPILQEQYIREGEQW